MIEFRNVSMAYKTGIQALKNVSFKVVDGEFVFIIGLSGSGKSTLIKLLTCEENPSEGTVLIDDYEISNLRRNLIPYLRRNIGMVFQDFRLIYSKTVYENVAFAMEIIGASQSLIKRRVPIVLSIVGLRDKASMMSNQLSGGEQQRVAIARAMVNNPMLILADEPTGNLDPVNSESIMALLEEVNCSGTTVVVCTHESNIVNKMRRRVIEISDGCMVRDELLGEYNLETSSSTRQMKKRKSQSGGACPPQTKKKSQTLKTEPFVRNINIKFSEEEQVIDSGNPIAESEDMVGQTDESLNDQEILAAVSDYYQKMSKDYRNPDFKNPKIHHDVTAVGMNPESAKGDMDKSDKSDTEGIQDFKSTEIMEDVDETNDFEHTASNEPVPTERIDFGKIIKPKRIGDSDVMEESK